LAVAPSFTSYNLALSRRGRILTIPTSVPTQRLFPASTITPLVFCPFTAASEKLATR